MACGPIHNLSVLWILKPTKKTINSTQSKNEEKNLQGDEDERNSQECELKREGNGEKPEKMEDISKIF